MKIQDLSLPSVWYSARVRPVHKRHVVSLDVRVGAEDAMIHYPTQVTQAENFDDGWSGTSVAIGAALSSAIPTMLCLLLGVLLTLPSSCALYCPILYPFIFPLR